MAKIQFKGKIQTVRFTDESLNYDYIRVPEFDRRHCDMPAFRSHSKYGSYANSDLFRGILRRIRAEVFGGSDLLKLNAIPEGVNVDTSGFLATVSIDI